MDKLNATATQKKVTDDLGHPWAKHHPFICLSLFQLMQHQRMGCSPDLKRNSGRIRVSTVSVPLPYTIGKLCPWEANLNLTQGMEQCHIANPEDPEQTLCWFKSWAFLACFYAPFPITNLKALPDSRIDEISSVCPKKPEGVKVDSRGRQVRPRIQSPPATMF